MGGDDESDPEYVPDEPGDLCFDLQNPHCERFWDPDGKQVRTPERTHLTNANNMIDVWEASARPCHVTMAWYLTSLDNLWAPCIFMLGNTRTEQ